MKWLTIDETLEAAREVLDDEEVTWYEDVLCKMHDLMALRLAQYHRVTLRANSGPGEGGIMVAFAEGANGERPAVFDRLDPSGDWD